MTKLNFIRLQALKQIANLMISVGSLYSLEKAGGKAHEEFQSFFYFVR